MKHPFYIALGSHLIVTEDNFCQSNRIDPHLYGPKTRISQLPLSLLSGPLASRRAKRNLERLVKSSSGNGWPLGYFVSKKHRFTTRIAANLWGQEKWSEFGLQSVQRKHLRVLLDAYAMIEVVRQHVGPHLSNHVTLTRRLEVEQIK